MRLIVETVSGNLVQVARDAAVGDYTVVNGVYVIDSPPGVEYDVSPAGFDSAAESTSMIASPTVGMLSLYPQFTEANTNTFHLETDITVNLDLVQTVDNLADNVIPGGSYTGLLPCKYQIPTTVPGSITRVPPNSVFLLADDRTTGAFYEPGCVVTSLITPFVPFDQYMVYWKIYGFATTDEINTDYGANAGVNSPAMKIHLDMDQEASYFVAAISIDGGAYTPVNLLEPVVLPAVATTIRLAFMNTHTDKLCLAQYAVLTNTP